MTALHHSTFNLLENPLAGTNLIEASAGTGKTYTITGLFLLLILEKHLSAEEILVVTFTEAATAELKDRIRSRLREAIAAFSQKKSNDKTLNALVEKYKDNLEYGLERLYAAIRDFDEAAIYTIHGFCQRMLYDNAFESGSLFDTELITEQERLKQEIVEDFWRKHFYDTSPLFVNYAIKKEINPANLLSMVNHKVSQPYLKIIPEIDTTYHVAPSCEHESEFKEIFDTVRDAWQISKPEVRDILIKDKALNRKTYGTKSIPVWIDTMDECMAFGNNNPLLFDKFINFTSDKINDTVKKNCIPPTHNFFNLCNDLKNKQETLAAIFDKYLLNMKIRLFHYVNKELGKRKQTKNSISFDDLLLNLHHALKEKTGEVLAENIRKKFKAALIDEFQDTDPIQYAIFKKVFDTNGNTPLDKKASLFLIGDPKQAIYGFRGADVFAYMDAAKNAAYRYTLAENWRSEKGLIHAINTLFNNTAPAFIYDEIPFEPVNAPEDKADAVSLTINGKSEPPLQLWFVKRDDSEKQINKTNAKVLIVQAVAAEISRLLDNKENILLGKEPIKEGDIAVLVRKNAEAKMMQEALVELNIPSILYGTDNIFDSYEALEMERILASIAQPNNEKLLKVALSTEIMGGSGEQIDEMGADESAWEDLIIKFRSYHDLWNKHGFIRMFKQFISQEKILPRLMKFPDGERRNTNLLHLAEILHQASVEKKLAMTWLVKWLSEQRDPKAERLEEHLLRLESDENAVKLVTIHKSKGLEYPIVFAPFTWDGVETKETDKPILFHDEENNREATLDLGSEQIKENRFFFQKELLAENLRLLYVALTRAKHRAYLIWGSFNKAETSALAYLFHYPNPSLIEKNIFDAMKKRFEALSDADMLAELDEICCKADGMISLSEIPTEPGITYFPFSDKKEELDFQRFSRKIDDRFNVSSFSSLTSSRANSAELRDYDEVARQASNIEAEPITSNLLPLTSHLLPITSNLLPITSHLLPIIFPKGATSGRCLHEIFENLDFTEKEPAIIENLVTEKLKAYEFDLKWQEIICDMIHKVLSVSLDPNRKDFTLSRIPNENRLNELEFYFPLNEISPAQLKEIFSYFYDDAFPESVGRLNFSPVQGFMKGFIDMVFLFEDKFYLIDWKSNFLGESVEDYHQQALKEEMKAHYYILQYHIYTLALHQYLRQRKPDYNYETDFGGVYYIFLRGVDPTMGPEFGIFRDRPTAELIEALFEQLVGGVQKRAK